MAELERLPAVETSGIYVSEEPTNTVHYYRDGQTIAECPREIAQPISFERIRRNLGVDGILVNMVSGFDMTIETLDQIRMAVRGSTIPMHFDYHNLTLGIGPDHRRYRRPIPEWRRWAFMMDIVQLNEIEVAGLTMEDLPEDKTVGHLLTLGVKGVVVTRGQRGGTVYHNEHKCVVREDVAGVAVDGDTDAVGSGDVFGAAFHYRYVKTPELLAAAELANRAAASHVQRHIADKLF
jgi:sugar/nucleoside kinase (ribokinase family)